jgi:uncharacterized membrane protein YfcA
VLVGAALQQRVAQRTLSLAFSAVLIAVAANLAFS